MQDKQEKDDVKFILDFIDQHLLVANNELLHIKKIVIRLLLTKYKERYQADKLFIAAVSENRRVVAKMMLQNNLVDPAVDNNAAICIAAEKGYQELVRDLLKYPEVNPAIEGKPLYGATMNGHTEVVVCLLNDARVDPKVNDCQAFRVACHNKHDQIIRDFLHHKEMKKGLHGESLLIWLTKNNFADAVRFVLREDLDFINKDRLSLALAISISGGFVGIVENLLNDGRVHPESFPYGYYKYTSGSTPLVLACEQGQAKIVKLLLNHERVVPTENKNSAIKRAASKGHLEVIKVLLADGRANPFEEHEGSSAVAAAVKEEHVDIVLLFLRDPRANPKGIYSLAITAKKINVMKAMVKNGFAQVQDYHNALLRVASFLGDVETVKELLKDPTISPDACSSEAIRNASYEGHSEIVDLLLNDGRSNPQAMGNQAIHIAIEKVHRLAVVERLLRDRRIDPIGKGGSIHHLIINNFEILTLFLLHEKILQRGFFNLFGELPQGILLQNYPKIIQSLQKELNLKFLSHIMIWLLEGLAEIKIENLNPTVISMSQLEETKTFLYKNIAFLAQNNYYEDAIRCWLLIPIQSPYFIEARFEAFQCAYSGYRKQDDKGAEEQQTNKIEAFLDSLAYCYHDGKLIDLPKDRQCIFDCYLLGAAGITVSPDQLNANMLNLTSELRSLLIHYLILLAIKQDLSANMPQLLQINSFFSNQGFVAVTNKLDTLLPVSLKTRADVEALKPILADNQDESGLFNQVTLNIKGMLSDKNLKRLIKIVCTNTSPVPTLQGNK